MEEDTIKVFHCGSNISHVQSRIQKANWSAHIQSA